MEATNTPINNNQKRTKIESKGKINLLEQLFKDTGYTNSATFNYSDSAKGYLTAQAIMLEGIDFDLVYTPLKHLGYKAVLLAIGNLYAAGYAPVGLSVTLALSNRFVAENIVELWTGMLAAAKEHKIKNLSLDLTASINGLSIFISAIGEQDLEIVKSFPLPDKNSLLCLTGNVGAAYMGMHVLEREKIAFNKIPADKIAEYKQPDLSKYKYILSQYLSPEINPKTLEQFKEVSLWPAGGVFITKGLAAAVKELCKRYGFGARIYLEKIPIAMQTFDFAQEIGVDATTAALNGGDDYKFLFVIPLSEHEKFHKEFPNVDIIGHFTASDAGEYLVTPEGTPLELRAQGW